MRLVLSPRARRELRALDPPTRERIVRKLEWFIHTDDPLIFAQPLTDARVGQWRFRIGDWRIAFDVDHDTINILRIGNRRDIYQ